MKPYVRVTLARALQMANAMADHPCTVAQLADLSGLSKPAIARWLKASREQVHIAGYTADTRGRMFAPQWAWGAKPDVARPGSTKTAAQRMRDFRARMRKVAAGDDLFE
jgi:hypothetical protein